MTPDFDASTRFARRTLLKGGGAVAVVGALPLPALAQVTSTLIVPFTPGASNDVVGRLVAEAVTRRGKLNWIVENKPGAGSLLGTDVVAKAAPDGRTLLLCATANMGILPAIAPTVKYSVPRDFSFLARVASSPFGLTVHPQLGASTLDEFVKLAKAKPGTIRLGSAGLGALDYMGASLLQSHFGIQLNIIPYKGMSPLMNDLRAGHLDAAIATPATVKPFVLDNSLRMLVVFDSKRSAQLPQVPSAPDVGHPTLKVVNWWGIAGPAKMPAATLAQISTELLAVLRDPAFEKAIVEKGFEPAVQEADAFRQFVLADGKEWAALAKRANIKME